MSSLTLKVDDLSELARYVSLKIEKLSGNILGHEQQHMVVNRLQRRLMTLGLSPKEYAAYLSSNADSEINHLVSLLTTHHTYFFREFSHFEYLLKSLPGIVSHLQSRGERKIKVLSAACSKGHEVYSLATFFEVHLKSYPGISYEIIGVDIDRESIQQADNGVYLYKEVKTIPQLYLSGNWRRGTQDISQYVKIKKEIKAKCSFKVGNLFDLQTTLGVNRFDIIFCRNVFIYFSEDDVKKVCLEFKKYLNPRGLFITGLSESLKRLDLKLTSLAPSVYTFDPLPVKEPVVPLLKQKKIKVLIVDDSLTVQKLLEQVFLKDESFEVVGKVFNGKEAEAFLLKNVVDVMTLDIHMEVMDGVEYLKKNYKEGHPKVIAISSASREDRRYAQEMLDNGAVDFIEKPSLNNLSQKSEEIRSKVKLALALPHDHVRNELIKRDFSVSSPTKAGRVVVFHEKDQDKCLSLLKSFRGDNCPIYLVSDGDLSRVKSWEKDPGAGVSAANVYSYHQLGELLNKLSQMKISVCILGEFDGRTLPNITPGKNLQVLVEDVADNSLTWDGKASDIFPWTSFAHIGAEFLAVD